MGTERFFGDTRQNDEGARGQEQGMPGKNRCRSSLKSAEFVIKCHVFKFSVNDDSKVCSSTILRHFPEAMPW